MMKINHLPKIGIIQAALQTLNTKLQNTKIGTTNTENYSVVFF